jgi:hypothetical protein
MAQHVSPEAKQRRSEELRAAVDEMADLYRRRFMGSTCKVLWEEETPSSHPSPRGRGGRGWTGLTDNYLRVEMDSKDDLLGMTSDVVLDSLAGDRFRGVIAAAGGD